MSDIQKEDFPPIKALPHSMTGSLVIFGSGNPRAHRYVRVKNEVFHVGRFEQGWHEVRNFELPALAAALSWSVSEVRKKVRRAQAARKRAEYREEFETWKENAARFGLEISDTVQTYEFGPYEKVSFRKIGKR